LTAVSLIDGSRCTREAIHQSPYGAWAKIAEQFYSYWCHVEYKVLRDAVIESVYPAAPEMMPEWRSLREAA
jgi:hypothetical protein